jgi:cardiolipin synthase
MEKKPYEDFTLLVDGKNAFPAIIAEIEKAKKSLEINMFIWRDDEIGNRLAECVLQAAERGVGVVWSVDRYGSIFEHTEESKKSFFHKSTSLAEKIKIKSLQFFYPENRTKTPIFDQESELYRQIVSHPRIKLDANRMKADHSKYYIIDGKILICGGINVEDKENGVDQVGREYQDYMVKMDGEEYVRAFKAKLEKGIDVDKDYFFGVNSKICTPYNFEMEEKYLSMIDESEKELTIVMAYFSPLKKFMNGIVAATKRGVNVRIMIPEYANLQTDTNRKAVKLLMKKCGDKLRVYYTPKMSHTKLIYTEKWMTFGSTNITKKTFCQLAELNLFVRNLPSAFTEKLKNSVEENFALSRQILSPKEIKYNLVKVFMENFFS